MEGSGVDTTDPGVTTTLSRPFELSFGGSSFRNSRVVEEEVARNEVVNCSQTCVVPPAPMEFTAVWISTPFTSTFTVLVTPHGPPGFT